MSESTHVERARRRLRDRALARAKQFEAMRRQAVLDTRAIVHMIVEKYKPIRIYQWGSVLRPGGFRTYSDIDIAIEGVTDARVFFDLLGDVQALTGLPVDLVQIEKVEPEYAEDIRQRGKIVYERCGPNP